MRIKALFILLLLAACAPEVQQTHKIETFTPVAEYTESEPAALPMRSWVPAGKPKAIILGIHGFNDYSNGFELPGQYLKKHGIALFAYDQRGFGLSADRGIWGGNENLAADVSEYASQLKHKYPHTPLYILGESMGGAIAITAVTRPDFPAISGLILSAPGLWSHDTMPMLYRSALWSMAHTVPGMKFTGSQLHILASSNIPLLRQMGKDPLFIKATRVDAIYGLSSVMNEAYDDIPSIHDRTLFLYGKKDEVVPAKAMNSAVPRFTIPITIGYYPEGYHMLMRDITREVVLKDIVSWIKHKDAPLPSGFGGVHAPSDPAPKMTSTEPK